MAAKVEVTLLVFHFETVTAKVWVVSEREKTRAEVAKIGQNNVGEDEISSGSAVGCREKI